MRDRGVEEGLRQELRRGTLVLAVLAALRRELCGADLLGVLATAGVVIEPGALYPMLRRLEDQGLLASEWRVEDGRRRRFYVASTQGSAIATGLVRDLASLTDGLHALMEMPHEPA